MYLDFKNNDRTWTRKDFNIIQRGGIIIKKKTGHKKEKKQNIEKEGLRDNGQETHFTVYDFNILIKPRSCYLMPPILEKSRRSENGGWYLEFKWEPSRGRWSHYQSHYHLNQSLSCSLSGRFQEIVRQFLKL